MSTIVPVTVTLPSDMVEQHDADRLRAQFRDLQDQVNALQRKRGGAEHDGMKRAQIRADGVAAL